MKKKYANKIQKVLQIISYILGAIVILIALYGVITTK